MNERDKEIVESMEDWLEGNAVTGTDPSVSYFALVEIIRRLDKQLTEIVEAGEFIDELVQLANKADKLDDDYWLMDCEGGKILEIEIGQIRRLAQKLKEVKDE